MSKVLVTGGSGFLGSRVVEELKSCGSFEAVHTFRSSEYDLRQLDAVKQLFQDKPADTLVHLAAVVGGIGANMQRPGEFFYDNLVMGVHLVEQARLFGVKKCVVIGTICSYPKFTPVPFKEDEIWNGYPEETNAPYGLAKKMLMVQLDAYRRQYNFNGIRLLMVNLYGPGDNFDLNSSHVIPAMLRKFHEAKEAGQDVVTLWGDGSPSREFLYVDDAARAIRLATQRYNKPAPVNVGSGMEITMRQLANQIKRVVAFEGEIVWDTSKPNGQPRRCLDVSRAREEFGFSANMTFPMGLQLTYDWFKQNYAAIEAREKLTQGVAART
ncbi:MAG: GDP-L-fucose synthase [Oligoflexia bacterium]|nr:GDP-L-fucose synthase [Oligoflexia bacterium]